MAKYNCKRCGNSFSAAGNGPAACTLCNETCTVFVRDEVKTQKEPLSQKTDEKQAQLQPLVEKPVQLAHKNGNETKHAKEQKKGA